MADQEILREFLVTLGFDVDKPEQSKFDQTLVKTGKNVLKLGGVMSGVAGAAAAMVTSYASSMEKMFYISQRTKSSVTNLSALDFGGRQIGLEAGTMTKTVESLARTIRTNPGIQGFIESLGVEVKGRDLSKVLIDVVRQLKQMPFYVGSQFGATLGIDPDTLLDMENNLDKLTEEEAKNRQMFTDAGLDMDKSAEKMKDYMQDLKELEERFSILGLTIANKLLPYMKDFTRELNINLGAFTKWLNDPKQKAHELKYTAPTGKSWYSRMLPEASKYFGWDETPHSNKVSGKVVDEGTPAASGRPGGDARGVRNNNPGNIEYGPFARSLGATGSDGRFAIFSTPQAGLNAMAQLLAGYGRRGFNSMNKIIGRYAPGTDGNNVPAYAGAVARSMGVATDATLNTSDPAVLARVMSGMIQHENGYNPYTATQLGGAAMGATVVLQQKTEINVHGATSPEQTGRVVMAGQDRVNADATRNLVGAIR